MNVIGTRQIQSLKHPDFWDVFGDLIHKKASEYRFYVERSETANFSEESYQSLVRSVIEATQKGFPSEEEDEEQGEVFNPLEVVLYTAKNGASILDVTIGTNGPHIEARYESSCDSLTITGLGAGQLFEIVQGLNQNGPLKEWCSAYCQDFSHDC